METVTAHAPELTRLILERLAYLQRIRKAVLASFGPGEADDRMRASLVAAHAARALDVEDSPWFRKDVRLAMRAHGWRDIKAENVRLWKGVKAL